MYSFLPFTYANFKNFWKVTHFKYIFLSLFNLIHLSHNNLDEDQMNTHHS